MVSIAILASKKALSYVCAYSLAATLSLEAASKVIDDDICTSAAVEQRVCSSESTTGSRNHDGLAVPSQLLAHLEIWCDGVSKRKRKSCCVGQERGGGQDINVSWRAYR